MEDAAKMSQLCVLIERESEAQHQSLLGLVPETVRLGSDEPRRNSPRGIVPRNDGILSAWYYRTHDLPQDRFEEDVRVEDADELGRARVGHYPDSSKSSLEAESFLSMRRHFEWPDSSGVAY